MSEWNAGLASDEMSGFPSAASPLASMGIDLDELQKNPDLLARLTNRNPNPPAPNRSAVAAGAVGGAGDTQTPPIPVRPAMAVGAKAEPTNGYAEGMEALKKNLAGSSDVANAIPTTDPNVDRLTKQREALGHQEQLFDPQTGKMLAGDKPSTGTRIWRGVRGGLTGLATGGIPGAIVGASEPGAIRGGEAYGAPNKAYQRREQVRQQELGATDTALETARKNWEDVVKASKEKGSLLKENASAATDLLKGGTASELADIKQQLADVAKVKEADQKQATLEKIQNDLENRSRGLDLKQMSIEQQGRIQDLANQLRETKLQSDQARFALGTDAKSLEAERKARLNAIEDDWKAHPYWNKLTGDKNKEIATVNQDINGRLATVMTGAPRSTPNPAQPNPSAPPAAGAPTVDKPPQKGYTRIKASDNTLHDIPTRQLRNARLRDPKLTVVTGQ